MNEVSIIESLTPAVFTEKGKLDEVIKDIQTRVEDFKSDIETQKGRDEIKSFAFRIAKSKTAIDSLGKECVEEWKTKSKIVDAERKRVWDIFEDLQKKVRKPLTDWEDAEKSRIERHKANLQEIANAGTANCDILSIETMQDRLKEIELDNTDWEEFAELAKEAKEKSILQIKAAIELKIKREAEAKELEQLRQEAAIRAQREYEENIRKEAAEKAIKEAEAKAKMEREAVEKESERKELELKFAAEKAQREKLEAEQKAERAVEMERQRVATESARIAAEEASREADKKYKATVHKKVVEALQNAVLSTTQAEAVLYVICQGLVPHIKITY